MEQFIHSFFKLRISEIAQIPATQILHHDTGLRFVVQRTVHETHIKRARLAYANRIHWRDAFDEPTVTAFAVFDQKDDAHFAPIRVNAQIEHRMRARRHVAEHIDALRRRMCMPLAACA